MVSSQWGREESDATERLHFTFHFHVLEKEMVTHSSVLAWRIPGMAEPGEVPSMRLQESDTTKATSQQQQQLNLKGVSKQRKPSTTLEKITY